VLRIVQRMKQIAGPGQLAEWRVQSDLL
jgi:hypothetical protein